MRNIYSSYYQLTKPGIVYGNAIHIIACALFAWAFTEFNPVAIVGVVVGMSLIIASACVVNCITDRFADAKMDRTKNRPLPKGEITVKNAVIYAFVLGVVGVAVMLVTTNLVALACALVCHFTYTVVYAYAKRHTWANTMIGTIPGAMPALAGYAAADPSLPRVAWLLTLVVLVWQLPHFYALALYRGKDYAKSGLKMISAIKPRSMVVRHIVGTAVLYVAATALLFYHMPENRLAGGIIFASGTIWVVYALSTKGRGSDAWARKVFGTSLYMPLAMLGASIIAVATA